MENQMQSVREISVVTAEIKELCRQAENMALMYAIEIGRRLCEAKGVLEHGEWGEWLKNEVNFSQRTANNFMRLYSEYGSSQLCFFQESPNSQPFANLFDIKPLNFMEGIYNFIIAQLSRLCIYSQESFVAFFASSSIQSRSCSYII